MNSIKIREIAEKKKIRDLSIKPDNLKNIYWHSFNFLVKYLIFWSKLILPTVEGYYLIWPGMIRLINVAWLTSGNFEINIIFQHIGKQTACWEKGDVDCSMKSFPILISENIFSISQFFPHLVIFKCNEAWVIIWEYQSRCCENILSMCDPKLLKNAWCILKNLSNCIMSRGGRLNIRFWRI